MEHEPIKYHDDEFEDGEVNGQITNIIPNKKIIQNHNTTKQYQIFYRQKEKHTFYQQRANVIYMSNLQLSDSNDGYTPLQRPNTSTTIRETASSLPSSLGASAITKMEDASELDESLPESDTDSNSDCDLSTVRNRQNKKKVLK